MHSGQLRALLGHLDFSKYLLARVAGMMSNQMLMVAVGWHMYDRTGSALDLGLVGLFQFVPALLLTLPAGHLADRLRRNRIFAASMLLQCGVAFLLLAATQYGFAERELFLVVSIVLGVARAFQMPAQQALIPLLIPSPLLSQGIAMAASAMQVAIIAGPALGGLIYVSGAEHVYALCGLLLLVAAALMQSIHIDHQPSTEPMTLRSVFAGVAFIWQQKILLGATTLDLFAVLLGGATALLPIFARDILHTDPTGLGMLRAAPALGAFLISLLMLRWPLQRRAGPLLFLSVAIFGLATVLFGLSTQFALSFVALAVSGAADNISVVIRQSLVQLDTPNEIRGRVSAVNSIFIGASNQLGEFESGLTAEYFGPVASVVLGGVGTLLVAAIWLRLFPSLAARNYLIAVK